MGGNVVLTIPADSKTFKFTGFLLTKCDSAAENFNERKYISFYP